MSFETIDPDERKAYGFDFSSYMDEGDSISGAATWGVIVVDGTHATPEDILDGDETVVAGIASQFIANALDGVTYLLTCRVTTANGSVLERSEQLVCETTGDD
jgi:hypothetical protein